MVDMNRPTIIGLAAAGAVAGFLTFGGGVNLASAQEDTTTTTPEAATDDTQSTVADEGCDHDGDGLPDGPTDSDTTDTTDDTVSPEAAEAA